MYGFVFKKIIKKTKPQETVYGAKVRCDELVINLILGCTNIGTHFLAERLTSMLDDQRGWLAPFLSDSLP